MGWPCLGDMLLGGPQPESADLKCSSTHCDVCRPCCCRMLPDLLLRGHMHSRSRLHLAGHVLASGCWPGLNCCCQCSLLQASVMALRPLPPQIGSLLAGWRACAALPQNASSWAQPSLAALGWTTLLAPMQHVAAVSWMPVHPAATDCLLCGCCWVYALSQQSAASRAQPSLTALAWTALLAVCVR